VCFKLHFGPKTQFSLEQAQIGTHLASFIACQVSVEMPMCGSFTSLRSSMATACPSTPAAPCTLLSGRSTSSLTFPPYQQLALALLALRQRVDVEHAHHSHGHPWSLTVSAAPSHHGRSREPHIFTSSYSTPRALAAGQCRRRAGAASTATVEPPTQPPAHVVRRPQAISRQYATTRGCTRASPSSPAPTPSSSAAVCRCRRGRSP
jgi:hypothetical protein